MNEYLRKVSHISFILFAVALMLLLASCSSYKVRIYPDKSKQVDASTAVINVYIDNSGSMNGYVLPGSQFKDDMYSYVSALSAKACKTNYYYINTEIIPVHQSSGSFFQDLSSASFKSAGGSHKKTELVNMMRMMLKNADKNTVSVFASDCILDPDQGEANRYFYLRQTDMRNTISSYLTNHKDFGIIIYCLESSFDGFLYPVGQDPIKITTKRPYYIWVFGPDKLIGKLNKEVSTSDFRNGIKYSASFANCSSIPFTVDKAFSNGIVNDEMELNDNDKTFQIKADFSPSLLSDEFISDIKKYKPSDATITLEKIVPIKGDDVYTHEITVSYSGSCSKGFFLELNKSPQWTESMSDNNGVDIHKTCGIKYIIDGIAEAYKNVSPLKIDFEIKK